MIVGARVISGEWAGIFVYADGEHLFGCSVLMSVVMLMGYETNGNPARRVAFALTPSNQRIRSPSSSENWTPLHSYKSSGEVDLPIRLEFITAKECIQASRTWFVNCNNCPSNSRPFRYSRIYIDDSLVCAFERVSMVGVVRRGDEP